MTARSARSGCASRAGQIRSCTTHLRGQRRRSGGPVSSLGPALCDVQLSAAGSLASGCAITRERGDGGIATQKRSGQSVQKLRCKNIPQKYPPGPSRRRKGALHWQCPGIPRQHRCCQLLRQKCMVDQPARTEAHKHPDGCRHGLLCRPCRQYPTKQGQCAQLGAWRQGADAPFDTPHSGGGQCREACPCRREQLIQSRQGICICEWHLSSVEGRLGGHAQLLREGHRMDVPCGVSLPETQHEASQARWPSSAMHMPWWHPPRRSRRRSARSSLRPAA